MNIDTIFALHRTAYVDTISGLPAGQAAASSILLGLAGDLRTMSGGCRAGGVSHPLVSRDPVSGALLMEVISTMASAYCRQVSTSAERG